MIQFAPRHVTRTGRLILPSRNVLQLAEVEGFEPPSHCWPAVFKTAPPPVVGHFQKFLAEDPGLEPGSLFRGATLAPWSLTN